MAESLPNPSQNSAQAMVEVKITRDLALQVLESAHANPEWRDLLGYLVVDDYREDWVLVSLEILWGADGKERPCRIPRHLVRYRLAQPSRRATYRVRSRTGATDEIAGAVHGPAIFRLAQWLVDCLDLLTTEHLDELRRARKAAEEEERRRQQELERVIRDARQYKALKNAKATGPPHPTARRRQPRGSMRRGLQGGLQWTGQRK